MVSVLTVFISSTEISSKSEINRVMQENIKNVVETISEDIRKNWISWVSKDSLDNCDFVLDWNYNYKYWTKLCTNENVYYLAKESSLWEIRRISDMQECWDINDDCFLIWKNWDRLTNSSVSVKDFKLYLTNDYIPKITLSITMQPSTKKWVKINLIKESKIVIQTTISDRNILKQYN